MNKSFYLVFLIISFLGIPFFALGILNSMVSLKYETENLTDCISKVTGTDLCLTITVFKVLTVLSALSFVGLLIFKNRIVKRRINKDNAENE